MDLFPLTDKTSDENMDDRQHIPTKPLIEEDGQQIRIIIGKVNRDTYNPNDCIITILKYSQSVSIEKGQFSDDRFIFEDEKEIEDVVAALNQALAIIRNQSNNI